MKGYKRLFSIFALLLFVLAACAPNSPRDVAYKDKEARKVKCSETVTFVVYDLAGQPLRKYVSEELWSHYEYRLDRGGYYMYTRVADDPGAWNEFYAQVNEDMRKADEQLGLLYPYPVQFYPRIPNTSGEFDGRSNFDDVQCSQSAHWVPEIPFRLSDFKVGSLTMHTAISGSRAFVSVSSAGGSKVDYSFPLVWINQILSSSFNEGEKLTFNPEFVAPEAILDQQEYEEYLMRTLQEEGAGVEIAYMTLVVSDFQGRKELQPVIAKAMQIAAVEAGRPVAMTIRGMMSSGDYSVANISAHQDSISIKGWKSLFKGGISGSGGEMTLQANYAARLEDLIRASIFLVNP